MLSKSIDPKSKRSGKTREVQELRRCHHCQGTMKGVRKDAKFCGNVCRQSAYQSRTYRRKSMAPKPGTSVVDDAGGLCCLNCLIGLRGKQRAFCSDACRKQHHRG
jgi:hypothetical protein